MKKRDRIIAGAVGVYFVAALGIYCAGIGSDNSKDIPQQGEAVVEEAVPLPENNEAAGDIAAADTILTRHALPGLERMEQADQEQYVNHLEVIKRIDELGLDTTDMLCPEIRIAEIEEAMSRLGGEADTWGETVVFDGTTSQELQELINVYPRVAIEIASEQIEVTDAIMLHGNTAINGNGVRMAAQGIEYCFYAENADNIQIQNVVIDGGTEYGISSVDCDNIMLTGNVINGCGKKALSIAGTTDGLLIGDNQMSENMSGAVYIAGDVSNGLIEANTIQNSRGNADAEAGIVLTGAVQAQGPHALIIRNNKIMDNDAAGVCSDGAYMCYVLHNTICANDKEGIRLSHGTIGFYLGSNTLRLNGQRGNKTDEELQADFVLDAGRMEDGSSKAKLPGILLDNAAYNILENNTILGNYGGGINMPYTAVRNVILGNVVRDNNAGENDRFRFYGIALQADASGAEYAEADVTADYENIICRNIISGNHYSGIFIDEACYINDVFDNVVMDAQACGIEAISLKFNSIINNTTNCGVVNAFQ